jgi:predicted phosphoribosyltransferase
VLDETVAREARELRRRVARYRGDRPALDVRDRTVIVADDGLATGVTDVAAVRALRGLLAARVIVAVPVGVRASLARVGEEADEVVCHTVPAELRGVGFWYEDFTPVSDEQVLELLNGADAWGRREPG